MLRIVICFLLVLGVVNTSYSQGNKKNPANAPKIDQKKMAKANALISKAMTIKERGEQTEVLYEALDIYREMRMYKEGNMVIGDAFYNKGDLKMASRFYAKAGKENKEATNEKIGKAYLEESLGESDPKAQKKQLKYAYRSLSRSHGAAEANRLIGNEFFDMGMESYPQALEYYSKAGYHEGIYLIGDLYAAKPENIEQAANTYIYTKQHDGYKKAGDLYYDRGNLVKAMEYYATGGVIEGYKKFATELKKANKMDEYNTVVEIISDTLTRQSKTNEVKKYAVQAERDNNYKLAASLYGKLGETKLQNKYTAYSHMMKLEVIPAKELFLQNGQEDLANEIDNNIQVLTELQQSMFVLNELKSNVPSLSSKVNPHTGKLGYDPNDLKLRKKFYGNPVNQKNISDVAYKVSKVYKKLDASAKLAGLVRESLLQYRPIKNILDNYDFSVKIIPINITPAAVTF